MHGIYFQIRFLKKLKEANYQLSAYILDIQVYKKIKKAFLLLGYKDGGETIGLQVYHDFKKYSYYVTGGYSIPLNNTLSLQPSVLLHYELSYSVDPDFNLNLKYKDVFIGGLSFRPKEAFIFLFNYSVNYQAKIGVSYDFGLGELSNYHNGSFEITFQYEFGFKIKASDPGNF